MEERKSKVAWSGDTKTSGTADQETQKELIDILDEFGIAIEQESKISKLNFYLFPIFRKFEVAGIVTDKNIFYVISPYGGDIPRYIWADIRKKPDQLKKDRIVGWAQHKQGWTAPWLIELDLELLESQSRKPLLQTAARELINKKIEEMDKEARLVKINPIFEGRDFFIQNDSCFVLIPFQESFDRLHNDHIKPTLEKMGFKVIVAKDFFTSTPIINDIWRSINEASLIVADITSKNPNVFYELGIAHTIGKKSIILNQNRERTPFDISHVRYLTYTDDANGWKEFEDKLEKAVHATIG